MTNFYTYIHTKLSDNKVFYVGKGRGSRYSSSCGRSNYWMRTVNKHGFKADIAARWDTEKDAFEHEKFLISCFRQMGFDLVNFTDGGEGASGCKQSEETKRKRAASLKGRKGAKMSDENRLKLSLLMKGKSPTNKGVPATEEAKKKLSIAKTGSKHSQKTKEKMSLAQKGKQKSIETRLKMSLSKKGRVLSAETREKISLAKRQKKDKTINH